MEFRLQAHQSTALAPYSDKAVLPQHVLSTILDEVPNLPHPLIFSVASASATTLIGVREFSSPSDICELPKAIFKTLGVEEDAKVTIQLQMDVPRATSLQIKPLIYYSDLNWKFFLEDKLSKYYTCVAPGPLIIMDNNLRYELTVVNVNGEDIAACVVDTDVVLDVVPPSDAAAAQQLKDSTSNPLNNVLELTNEATLLDYKEFMNPSFVPAIFKVDATKYPSGMIITAKIPGGDESNVDILFGLDKFISMEKFRNASFEALGGALEPKVGSNGCRVVINTKDDDILSMLSRVREDDEDDDDKWVYVIPIVWERAAKIIITVSKEDPSAKMETFLEDTQELVDKSANSEMTNRCSNCGIAISSSKLVLHESFCVRNNKKCTDCGRVFLHTIPDSHKHCECGVVTDSSIDEYKHQKFVHSGPYTCECTTQFSSYIELAHHRASTCPQKLHECRFCHLVVPQGEATYQDKFENLTNHENACGNRTSECFKCSKTVRVKDLKKHMHAHDMEKLEFIHATKLNFRKCANENCVIILTQQSTNALGLCDLCYGPLYVQQHDPSNLKLQIRIERRYMMQMTKGCGNDWCDNLYCASSSASAAEIKGAPMKELFAVLKETLFANVATPALPINKGRSVPVENKLWFCVGEGVQRKKELVDTLVAEGGYETEMVYRAVNEAGDGSRLWLSER